jgi:AAA+ superfamily predicted ATPase
MIAGCEMTFALDEVQSEAVKWEQLLPLGSQRDAGDSRTSQTGISGRMARADHLKGLFRSHQARDDASFREIAAEIIREARRKRHVVLANELEKILNNSVSSGLRDQYLQTFDPPPRDPDRKTLLAEIKQPRWYLSDLILSDILRKQIVRIIDEFRHGDALEAHGLAPIRRALFCGPSGCGKTMTAQVIAAELCLPLLYVRFDAVVSSLLGETASNLRRVFEYAARGYWVLFFDEFDAIGRSRDDETEHGEIKRLVNSYLQLMDNFNGRSLIIAATNFERALDFAIWRRFDEVLRFDRPSDKQVHAFVAKILVASHPTGSTVSRVARSLVGASYADVERVCRDIQKHIILRGGDAVEDVDIRDALERHCRRSALMKVAAENPRRVVDRE